MSTARRVVVCAGFLFCLPLLVDGQPKYGLKTGTIKTAALTKARSYAWRVTRPAFDPKVDAMIVAAIDRELGARGLKKAVSGPGDVSVTYSSLARIDVDTKDVQKDGAAREFDVGTLVVNIANPTSRELLFQVRVDTPVEPDRTALEASINAAVAAIFSKYPVPPKAERLRPWP